MSTVPALEVESVGKSFNGVPVLRGVSFTVAAGGTAGLIGENGAGKSTLMNLLGGSLPLDAGRLRLFGQAYSPAHPTDAARAGIAFIHQELNLFPNLTIAENLFLTAFPRRGGSPLIDHRTLHDRAAGLLHRVGLELPPDTRVETLSTGERQLVEIARALSRDPRLVIFDEPTTSLSTRETAVLFALIRQLQAQGIAMIYISHHLDHVRQLCGSVVVLRDGAVVAQGLAAEFSLDKMIAAMVGRSLTQLYPNRQHTAAADPALEVRSVTQPGVVRDISFTLHRGEVLGLSGLMGAGRSELARILFGLDPHRDGEVRLAGSPLANAGPRSRIARGLAFLTEDRRQEGLCLEASIADNLALVALREFARPPLRLIDRAGWRSALSALRETVGLNASARLEQPVRTLSGGNQQKVVLGKWLLARPSVIILDEPTRGVDVGARFELYQLILDLADRGSAVLLISSEIEELIGLCDRILVMSQGEIRATVERGAFDRSRLLEASLPREAGR